MSEGVSEFESRSDFQGWSERNGKHFPLSWHQKWKPFRRHVRGPFLIDSVHKVQGLSGGTITYMKKQCSICLKWFSHHTCLVSLKMTQCTSKWVKTKLFRYTGWWAQALWESVLSWCPSSINIVWIPRCTEALSQTNRSFRGVNEPWNPIPVRCVDSDTKTCSYRPRCDGRVADINESN